MHIADTQQYCDKLWNDLFVHGKNIETYFSDNAVVRGLSQTQTHGTFISISNLSDLVVTVKQIVRDTEFINKQVLSYDCNMTNKTFRIVYETTRITKKFPESTNTSSQNYQETVCNGTLDLKFFTDEFFRESTLISELVLSETRKIRDLTKLEEEQFSAKQLFCSAK